MRTSLFGARIGANEVARIRKLFLQEFGNWRESFALEKKRDLSKQQRDISRDLERNGYAVLANYFCPKKCEELRTEIDAAIAEYEEHVWSDDEKSDHRLFGIDRASSPIRAHLEDPYLLELVTRHERGTDLARFTLAGRLVAADGNSGSGGGWHRDRADRRQTKTMAYLSDVSIASGPFQYVERSHLPGFVLRAGVSLGFEATKNRYTDDEIERVVACTNSRIKTFDAPAGTLILFNSRGLHRGAPIEKDVRYALTNYYFPNPPGIPRHIEELLVPEETAD